MKYKQKKQYRLKEYDYSLTGYYFVTICTHNKVFYFGNILMDQIGTASMALSEIGKIVRDCWNKITEYGDYVQLDEWVIMPNHIHGIIVLRNDSICRDGTDNDGGMIIGRDVTDSAPLRVQNLLRPYVDTGKNIYYPKNTDNNNNYFSKISPKSKSLGAIIRSFKSSVTKESKKQNLNFVWQPRFHDRIIRTQNELNIKRNYIKNNVIKWEYDRNNSK